MKTNYVAVAIAIFVTICTAFNAQATYEYQRVTTTSMLTEGCKVIITNSDATMAAGDLENGVLKGVPISSALGDSGKISELEDVTILTVSKYSTLFRFSSNIGKLGATSSSLLTFSPTQNYDLWALNVAASDINITNGGLNRRIKFANEEFAISTGSGASQTQLYIIYEVADPHDPWAEVYFVTSTNDYRRTEGLQLQQDSNNPDVYVGVWYAEPEEQGTSTGIGFLVYDPEQDKEYPIGPVEGADTDLEKSQAGKYVEVKCVNNSAYHWIVAPDFWDQENQSMDVAVNIHTGDAAFGKDIQTMVQSPKDFSYSNPSYFNLQGIPVEEPRNGIFIRFDNGRVQKLFVP